MTRRIHVDFRKWPDHPHWQLETEHLGSDRYGRWLWRAPGWKMRKGDAAPIVARHPAVMLIPDDGWYTALWNLEGSTVLYVDIATPAVWDGDRVTMVDLDLDVVVTAGGGVAVHDEDEFAEHQVTLRYPPELVAGARDSLEQIVSAVSVPTEPFASTAAGWLDAAVRRNLSPRA